MNQLVSEATIAILDRKYDFVINSPTDSFMLDLHVFMDFLHQDELIKDFTSKVREEFDEKARGYLNRLAREKQEAIEIKNILIEKYPDLDDSSTPQPTGIDDMFSWESTFAYFDKVVNESYRSGHPLESDTMDDNTDVRNLITVLSNKVALYEHRNEEGKKEQEMDKAISYRLTDLDRMHTYVHREWVNYARVAAGHTLYELEEIIKRINPEPEDLTEWRG